MELPMNTKKDKYVEGLWYFAVFAFFYIWFSQIHPLIVYDADDWTYLAYVRKATPIWGDWNPAKVFPEVIMPFLSNIILHTIVPLVGDYFTGFTVGHALIVSGFITAYAWCFVSLIRRSYSLSRLSSVLAGTLFLTFHFLVFRTQEFDNSYLFRCEDLNCYYNYLLPALLNASLVMFMMNNPRFEAFLQEGSFEKKGFFYILLYFTIFSNMVVSGILAAYAGCQLLLNLLKEGKKFKLVRYVKANFLHLLILLMWFTSAIFELGGGRAAATSSHSLFHRILDTAYCLKEVLIHCNPTFWIWVIVIAILSALQFLLTKERGQEEQTLAGHCITILIAGAALTVYMLILCALVWSGNIYRSEYQFPLFFYGFLLVLLGLGYLLKKQPGLLAALPLLLVFLVSGINTNGRTFEYPLMSDYDPTTCLDISRDILNQYLEADAAGLTETTIYIPMHVEDPVNEDNWPHSISLLDRIGRTLHEQGVIANAIHAEFVADAAVNKRHHIPVP